MQWGPILESQILLNEKQLKSKSLNHEGLICLGGPCSFVEFLRFVPMLFYLDAYLHGCVTFWDQGRCWNYGSIFYFPLKDFQSLDLK